MFQRLIVLLSVAACSLGFVVFDQLAKIQHKVTNPVLFCRSVLSANVSVWNDVWNDARNDARNDAW